MTKPVVKVEIQTNFNSHAHVERDPCSWSPKITISSISTHTLTWSVTNHDRVHDSQNQISTHTLTWSVTLTLSQVRVTVGISTHTLTWSVTRLYLDLDNRL